MKKIIIILVFLFVVILGFLLLNKKNNVAQANDYLNTTYKINGEEVKLINGKSEKEAAPGSASKVVTRFFGNEVKHDFDGDGREDIAFILTQETGGSGTFYYFVASLNKENGFLGSEAVFLGDRISPQSTNMGEGNIVVVNFAERKQGESFDVSPSVGKSLWLLLDPKTMQFGEVAQNFEGEADPAKMTLDMKVWSWIRTSSNIKAVVEPNVSGKFTLSFKKDMTFSAKTDCNGVGGEYELSGNKIKFNKMMSTLMFCEGSQETVFTTMLREAQSYKFTSKGELILSLKTNGGEMLFK